MTAPTPTPPCLGEREAVARTLVDAFEEAILDEHLSNLCTENETLRAQWEEMAELVCEFAAGQAHDAVELVGKDRDQCLKRALRAEAERDAEIARAEEAERSAATMRTALETIAQATPEPDDKNWYPGIYGEPAAYRMAGSPHEVHPDDEQPGDMDAFGFERGVHSAAVIARAALTTPEPPHGD